MTLPKICGRGAQRPDQDPDHDHQEEGHMRGPDQGLQEDDHTIGQGHTLDPLQMQRMIESNHVTKTIS